MREAITAAHKAMGQRAELVPKQCSEILKVIETRKTKVKPSKPEDVFVRLVDVAPDALKPHVSHVSGDAKKAAFVRSICRCVCVWSVQKFIFIFFFLKKRTIKSSFQFFIFSSPSAPKRYMQDIGEVIYPERGNLEGYMVINPHWFCEKIIGNLLQPETWTKKELQANNGVITVKNLVAKLEIASDEMAICVINLLQQLGFCYRFECDAAKAAAAAAAATAAPVNQIGNDDEELDAVLINKDTFMEDKVIIPALLTQTPIQPRELWHQNPTGGRIEKDQTNVFKHVCGRRLSTAVPLDVFSAGMFPRLQVLMHQTLKVEDRVCPFRVAGLWRNASMFELNGIEFWVRMADDLKCEFVLFLFLFLFV